MTRLAGRAALITGGASGIGRAIAVRLAAEGAHVMISDIDREAGAAAARESGFQFVEQDVTDEARWPTVIDEVEEKIGPLSILINNAGIVGGYEGADPAKAKLGDFRRIFSCNVESVFLGCRAAISAMRPGGVIINISSIAALRATPKAAAYAASKAAVTNLTLSVAQYCAQADLGIRCISVHPGDVQTDLWETFVRHAADARGVKFEDLLLEIRGATPLGELARPEDVAASVAFLVSDDARAITGAQLVVDAGLIGCSTFGQK